MTLVAASLGVCSQLNLVRTVGAVQTCLDEMKDVARNCGETLRGFQHRSDYEMSGLPDPGSTGPWFCQNQDLTGPGSARTSKVYNRSRVCQVHQVQDFPEPRSTTPKGSTRSRVCWIQGTACAPPWHRFRWPHVPCGLHVFRDEFSWTVVVHPVLHVNLWIQGTTGQPRSQGSTPLVSTQASRLH